MPQLPMFSHSRLKSFAQCPLKYRYRYLDRVPVEVENIEAFTGKRVHEVLEQAFRSGALPGAEILRNRFERSWREHWHEGVRVVKAGRTAEDYRRIGLQCLDNFIGMSRREMGGETLGLEQRITVDLDPDGKYRMQGYIDRLVLASDGFHEIHDFKTGGTLPRQSALDADPQLAIYHLGLEEKLGRRIPSRLVWHYLYFGKSFRSSRTPEQLDALRADLISRIRTIESAKEFPARVTPLCRWCDFESICPARRPAGAGPPAGNARGRVEEGARLVDGYVALMEEEDDPASGAVARRREIRAALLDFSRREGVEAIAGMTHVARIRRTRRLRLPPPGTVRRRGLESFLRREKLWDGRSDLDPDLLLLEIDRRPAAASLREAVNGYGSLEDAGDIQLVPLSGGQLKFFE